MICNCKPYLARMRARWLVREGLACPIAIELLRSLRLVSLGIRMSHELPIDYMNESFLPKRNDVIIVHEFLFVHVQTMNRAMKVNSRLHIYSSSVSNHNLGARDDDGRFRRRRRGSGRHDCSGAGGCGRDCHMNSGDGASCAGTCVRGRCSHCAGSRTLLLQEHGADDQESQQACRRYERPSNQPGASSNIAYTMR